jgi:hypothetical protein
VNSGTQTFSQVQSASGGHLLAQAAKSADLKATFADDSRRF